MNIFNSSERPPMQRIWRCLLALLLLTGAGQATPTALAEDLRHGIGEDYDPASPGNPGSTTGETPQKTYRLTLIANPKAGGEVYTYDGNLTANSQTYVYSYPAGGFKFVNWTIGDEVVSTSTSFYFTMPEHDVTLTANFIFDPSSPGNPSPVDQKVTHPVTVSCEPRGSASMNPYGTFNMEEHTDRYIYAYPESGWKLTGWMVNGEPMEQTTSPLYITMGEKALDIKATLYYDPSSPSNPAANYYNPSTGQLILDDFTPGYIYSAVSNLMGYNEYDNVSCVIVKGEITSNDIGNLSQFRNAGTLDLSRTWGLPALPSYAFENSRASDIILPSTLTRIGNYAFYDCVNLASITIYAQEPPECDNYAFDYFTNKENCTVYVPASAIELYSSDEQWKDFLILPITNDAHILQVNLPEVAQDGRYKHYSLEIVNVNSGIRQKYVVADRMLYTFNGLQKDEQYNIYLFSQSGLEVGRVENVVIPDKDIEITLDNLKTLHNVTAKVTDIAGTDLTDKVTVEWLRPVDGANPIYLRKAASISEIPEGQELICRVTLDNKLGSMYSAPADIIFTAGGNVSNMCEVTLVPFRNVILSGTVTDGDGAPLNGASVSATQTLNGKYPKTFTAKTDRQGKWSMTVLDAPETQMTYAAPECINVTATVPGFEAETSSLDLGKTVLKSIVGARVSYAFTYHEPGSDDTENYYPDYQNVLIDVYNVTQERPHDDVSMQYPLLAVLDENINAGDQLRLTATSKTGAFKPIEKMVTLGDHQRTEVTFDIVGKGGISAQFEMTDNAGVLALLYSKKGELVKKTPYAEAKALFSGLDDGDYTLISMGESTLMGSILKLSSFAEIGLTEGKDYVKNDVQVESGRLTEVKNPEIPIFDESLFYYTTSTTGFSSNKSSVTTGNYLTLRSAIDFKGVYKNDISNVALVVDLPEACDMVEQSVIQGPTLLPYTLDNNRLTIQLGKNYQSQTRFCVLPTAGGSFNATASVVFDYNGKTVMQPIGSAVAEIKDIEIIVPSLVADKTFKVSGKASPNSQVTIYCYNSPMAVARSNKNGSWTAECTIEDPISKESYPIYAKINLNGSFLETETKSVMYDYEAVLPSAVTMSFYNNYYHKNYVIEWDFIDGTVSNPHYDFYTTTDFTFRIDFTRNDPDAIGEVILCVKTNKGTVTKIPANYDNNLTCWIATDEFSSDALPCNISLMYARYETNMCSEDFISDNFSSIMPTTTLDNYTEVDNGCVFTVVDDDNLPLYHNLYKVYHDQDSLNNDINQLYEIGFIDDNPDKADIEYLTDELGHFAIVNFQNNCLYLCYDNMSSQQFLDVVNLLNLKSESSLYSYPNVSRIAYVNYGGDQIGESTDWLNRQRDRIIQNAIDEANRKLRCADEYDNIRIHDLIKRLRQSVGLTIGSFFAHSANLTMATHGADPYNAISGAGSFGSGMDGISQMGQDALRELHSIPGCGDPDDGNDNGEDFPDPTNPILDPSGYVFEAVPENRVEGVQATIYYKETKEDMYGDPYEDIVLWDAEEYAQKNPLFTDENGMYQWDVPQGLWQVKFEKDGYVTAFSEWLPVPPPQLDVNIGIVQNKQPEVIDARAYEEGVEVQFDKFMNPSTLTTDNIYVTANGEKLAGEVRLMDSSLADEFADEEDADATRYASRVRFIPDEPLSVTTGEVRITVSRNVLSYAGIPMTETYSQAIPVVKEVQAIAAEDVKVLYGGEKEVTVFAAPFDASAGRTLRIATSSDMIVSVDTAEAILDDEGKAVIKVKGELPGRAQLRFTIDDVTVTGDCAVDVVTRIVTAEAPQASRASDTAVYKGTKVSLSTDSENATIYFTTDGSCPCDENGTRRKYTVPIVINEDMHILAVTTVGNGEEDMSEISEFNYTIKHSDMDFMMETGWNWISHNFDTPVDPAELAEDEAVSRILSQTQEVVRDPKLGMTGTLKELPASQSYKVETTAATACKRMSDIAWNPANPITLTEGWNWLGYPVGQTMTPDEAFAPTAVETLDVVVGQNGFAQYDGEKWVGTLETLTPGTGYMYHSQSAKSVVYNTSIVSTAAAKYVAGISDALPLALDIHRYATVMPMVAAVTDADNHPLDNEDYWINAFCGTECRGIGRLVNGLFMMNVYGNPGDAITFLVTDAEGKLEYPNTTAIEFSERIVGDIFNPFEIEINGTTGVRDTRNDGNVKVYAEGDMLRITGVASRDIELVEIYDTDGHKLLRESNVAESGIRLPKLSTGIYLVVVKADGTFSYHKIALR